MLGFDADDLLECYRHGVFPMADSRDDPRIFLIDPERRGVLPLDRFHVSHRLARTIRSESFEVSLNRAFDTVVAHCAAPRGERGETWINSEIEALYAELHVRGLAHSIECWAGERLVGGLYGVALGAAFFGESMFSQARDASKVALAHLVARLKIGRFRLLDAQFMTEHLAQFGAEEITRAAYRRRLATALAREGDFYAAPARLSGPETLQAISQAS